MRSQPLWIVGTLYIVAYAGIVWLSAAYTPNRLGIVPWGPQTGLAFAAFLLIGSRLWPFLIIAVAAGDFATAWPSMPLTVRLLAPIIIGGGYSLALYVLTYPALRFDPYLRTLRDVLLLETTAILSSTTIAVLYVNLLAACGVLHSGELLSAAFRFAISDLIGISIVTPLLLLGYRGSHIPTPNIENGLQGGSIAAALVLAFGFPSLPHFRLFNVVFFPIIWIALRYGLQGAAYGLFVTQLGLIAALHFIGDQPGNLPAFQGLMLVLAFTGLAIGGLVSERRRVEQQLRLHRDSGAEIFRLGSAGELATAIAHEINQPLTAIANYTQIIQRYLDAGLGNRHTAIEAAAKVSDQVARTDAVIKSFRELVRRGRPRLKSESVYDVLSEAVELTMPMLQQKDIDASVSVERDTHAVMMDRLQIEQVLINLIQNSTEAMSARPIEQKRLSLHAANVGTSVEITVADNGPGFPSWFDIRRPAMLLSEKAEGLGVGLSFCRTIVESHRGELRIGGSADGAVVTIRLPGPTEGQA